jgi:hypothetical protein
VHKTTLLLILMPMALLVPGAAADTIIGRTSISVQAQPPRVVKPGARVVVSGKLISAKALCRSSRAVRLRRTTKGGGSVQLQRTRTNSRGSYRFVLHPAKTETVYVSFAGLFQSSYVLYHRCQPSRSRSITIRTST